MGHLVVRIAREDHAERFDQEWDLVFEKDDVGPFVAILFFGCIPAGDAEVVLMVAGLLDIEKVAPVVIPESFVIEDVV
jgi:hypothetical protein